MAAPTPLVSVEELGSWLRRPLTGDDARWAELVLTAVSSLVRSHVGRTWDGAGETIPENARSVTFTVAARVFRNPEAASSYSKSRGPFSESVTFADPKAVGLYLSDEEKQLLGRLRGSGSGGLWTLGTTRSDAAQATGYVPVDGSPQDFPWYVEDV